jgi:thiol-disulfide isomerase/thioredoxin
MKYKKITLIVLALISVGLIVLSLNRDNLIKHMSFKEFPLKSFTLNDLSNAPVEVKSDDGRAKLIIFWASWCPTCKDDLKFMVDLDQRQELNHIDILAISVDNSVGSALLALSQNKIEPGFRVLLDPENQIAKTFEVYGVPESFLVNKNGQVIKRFVGPVNSQRYELLEGLKGLSN